MTTEQALLAAVLAKPEDDLPRLALADHLDELTGGYSARAEFIRVQVELDRPCTACKGEGRYDDDMGGTMQCRGCYGKKTMRGWEKCESMRRRERELWNFGSKGTWVDAMYPAFDCILCVDYESVSTDSARDPILIARRGFVAEVRCTQSVWCETCLECGGYGNVHACGECRSDFTGIGPAVVVAHPVMKVVLSDREPADRTEVNDRFYWFKDEGHMNPHHARSAFPEARLPAALFNHLSPARNNPTVIGVPFESRESALNALSAACLAWAKSQPHPARIEMTPVSVDFVMPGG